MERSHTLETLPIDVISIIVDYLGIKEIFSILCVSHNIRDRTFLGKTSFGKDIPWQYIPAKPVGVRKFGSPSRFHNLRSLTLRSRNEPRYERGHLELVCNLDFKSFTRLEELDLGFNFGLGEKHLKLLKSAHLTRLTSLSLSNMACVARHQLQRDTLTSTVAVLTNLKSLNLLGIDDHRSRDWEKPILSTILSLNKLERVTLPPFIKDWPSLKTLPCLKKLVVSNPDAVIAVEHLSEGIFSKEHCLKKAPGYFGWYISLLEELPIDLDVAKSDGTSYSFLHSACRSRKDTGIVAHMLTLRHKIKCFDPDYRNAIGQTPLMLTKSIEIATALLDAGADVNACFYEERFLSTPLSVAIIGGKLALARLLLARGASFILGSPLPLIAAADHTDPQIRDLAYHHAPALLPKIQSDEHLFAAAALFFRSISPQAMVATLNSLKKEKLLQFVQYRDDDGRSVLHSLCARRPSPPGSEAVIQRLLDAGADPIQKDSTGLSPLWNAIKSAPEAIVRLLISRTKLTPETDSLGTDKPSCLALLIDKGYHDLYMEAIPNFQAAHFSVGRKPLAYDICLRCEPEDIRQIVKDVGPIDFNCKRVGSSGDGDYPIFAALATGESRMLQVLLEHHADPNVFNEFGLSALMISLACNEEGACRLLLDAGADPNPVAVPKYASNLIPIKQMAMVKQTPLTYAIRKFRVNDIQALLEKGADPNLPNGEGFTPLTLLLGALSTSHKRAISDILRLLLQHNADVNVPDAKDTLPLIALLRTDWKVLSNEKQIFLKLLEAGAKPVSWKRYETLGRQDAEKICPSALEAAICWRLDFDVLGKILDAAPDLVQQISPEGFLPLFAAVSGVYSGQSSRSSLYCSPLDVLLLRFLLERGADPRQLNGKRRTVMKHCAASNMIQYAKDIIDHDRAHNEGARASDPMSVDLVDAECTEEGHTPLAIALSRNRVDFALLLLEEGADANRTSAFDSSTFLFTPLSMAVFCGSAKVVEALLNRGADVKAKSRNRDRTALSDALNRPKINHEVVRLLVDAGSDLAALSATELLALEASREGLQPDNHPNPFEHPTTGALQFGSDAPPRFKFDSPSAAEVFGLHTNPLPTTETPFGSSANPFGSTSSSSSRSSRSPFRPRKPATTTFGRTSSPFSSFPSSSDNLYGSSNTASPFSSPSLPADPFGSTPTMSPVCSSPFAMTSTTSPVVASATVLSSNPFAAVSLIDSAKQSTPNPFQ